MILDAFKLCFWDFDGVIKESVEVKTQAYFSLFELFGPGVASKVRKHHIANGGMSRLINSPFIFNGLELNLPMTFLRIIVRNIVSGFCRE